MFDPSKIQYSNPDHSGPFRYPLPFPNPIKAKKFMETYQHLVAELCRTALLEYRRTDTLTLRAPNLEILEMIVNVLYSLPSDRPLPL